MDMTQTLSVDWNGLSELRKRECNNVVRKRWPRAEVGACSTQGACSYTVVVISRRLDVEDLRKVIGEKSGVERDDERHVSLRRDSQQEETVDCMKRHIGSLQGVGHEEVKFIVQFRPERYALDVDITAAAKETYGPHCPYVELVESNGPGDVPRGLQMYALEFVPGVPYSKLQPRAQTLDTEEWTKQLRLVESFAQFVGRAWPTRPPSHRQQRFSLSYDPSRHPVQMTGKVGASVKPKLAQLALDLPTAALRAYAQSTLSKLPIIESLPIVVNHGDLIPANVMVERSTGDLVGLVDWAEAEHLPFGTCLYGLEFLLGWVDHEHNPEFVYFSRAEDLRALFWQGLARCVGIEDVELEEWRNHVTLARDLGVLLWFGFAWDDGRIDRVVNREDDAEVVECLEAFLRVGSERAML